MDSTLWELRAFDRAFDKQREVVDSDQYLMGEYVFEAVSAALANVLKKKSAKAVTFKDMRNKPLLQMIEDERKEETGDLSDEEKKRRTEQLFMNLQIMAANFNISKQNEGG